MWKLRTLTHYLAYLLKVRRDGVTSLIVDALLLLSSVWVLWASIGTIAAGPAIVTVALAFFRLMWGTLKLVKALRGLVRGSAFKIDRRDQIDFPSTRTSLADISPSLTEEVHGFRATRTSSGEVVFASASLDAALFDSSHDWTLRRSTAKETRLHSWIKRHREQLLPILNRQVFDAAGRKRFENDAKFALAGDLTPAPLDISYARVGYFDSFLTNEACTIALIDDDDEVAIDCTDLFPAELGANGKPRLCNLAISNMANHVGASTIGFTRDRAIVLWEQSSRAMQSEGLLVPTGSGSSDWSDIQESSLRSTIMAAMRRELHEESVRNRKEIPISRITATRLLGYFRWLRRGGKPEFIGITLLDIDSGDLDPDPTEVKTPGQRLAHCYPATCLDDIDRLVTQLLSKPKLSVPLEMNLRALRNALSDPDRRSAISMFLYASSHNDHAK